MIDTVKIYTEIDKITHDKIKSLSVVKSSIDNSKSQVLYEITNDSLVGSYDSRLSIRVGCGVKYHFVNLGYYIEIEGSYHKLVRGYNSHNGFCDLQYICSSLITIAELSYDVFLPSLDKWFLQRCDIAICYNINNQDNVKSYINSLSRCNYPRRNMKFYSDESIYLSGTTTTLKIYNKLLEFKKHDIKKFQNSDFDLINYLDTIKGFIRFECEIKKKMLVNLYNLTHIKIIDVCYDDLKKIWSDEFMKLLKFIESDLDIVRGRDDVLMRLESLYKPTLVNVLFNFYCSIQLNGLDIVKSFMSSSSYYRNIKFLKNAGIDISQSYKVEEIEIFSFNPFEWLEVA